MFRTAADGLHRSPHIVVARHQIPARRQEIRGLHTAAQVIGLGSALAAIRQRGRPDNVTVSIHYRMRAPKTMGFFRVQRGVNSAEDYIGAALPRHFANLISAQGIPRMDTDADDIATLDAVRIYRTERFIDEKRIAEGGWRSSRKYIQPTRRNNGSAKRHMARIDKVDPQALLHWARK